MRTVLQRGSWSVVTLLGLFLFAALNLSLYLQLELPETTGAYAVGRTIFRWVDLSRPEVLTENLNDHRELTALVWHPAELGTGKEAGYFPDISALSDTLIESGEVERWEVLGLSFIRSRSPFDAEPLKAGAPFPVVILSPGNGTNIEFYSSLASEIASHGYIVVGLNHPYDVPAVLLSDGSIAGYDKAQWALKPGAHQKYTQERITVRTQDVLFALDQLTRLNSDSNKPFAGILDLDSIAVAGHSLGGITASEACKADPRFKACLSFDGLLQGGPFSAEETMVPPPQPFLFLTKETQLHPKIIQAFESTTESYWVVIHGASHDSFTDGPLLRPSLLLVPNQADRFMSVIQKYTVAFLDQTLRGEGNISSLPGEAGIVSRQVFPSKK
jgi:dienelactone hydrolase